MGHCDLTAQPKCVWARRREPTNASSANDQADRAATNQRSHPVPTGSAATVQAIGSPRISSAPPVSNIPAKSAPGGWLRKRQPGIENPSALEIHVGNGRGGGVRW